MKNEIISNMVNLKYKTTLKGVFIFELKSLLGRVFYNKQPKTEGPANYLHLGCGTTLIDGYVNADFFGGFKFWKINKQNADWMLDFRYPLNCPHNTWNGVFTEHALEHLYPDQVLSLLLELNRTMIEGALIRIVVPDLEYCIDRYQSINLDMKASSACQIWDLTQNWMHLSVWNYDLMRIYLEEAGFCNIKKVSYGEGRDRIIIKDNLNRKNGSLYVEAEKK